MLKQAGAELCQAQVKLGLDNLSLLNKKLSLVTSFKTSMSAFLYQILSWIGLPVEEENIEVQFSLKREKMRSSSIWKKNKVVFL